MKLFPAAPHRLKQTQRDEAEMIIYINSSIYTHNDRIHKHLYV